MTIILIAGIAEDGTIGDRGKIPWHISGDLKRFKRLTMGHPIIMGRKTYESIGKPLPGRTNIVLTRSPSFATPPEVLKFDGLDAALDHCRKQREEIVFVIGGREVYRQTLPVADKLFLTEVHRPVTGDTKFPDYDRSQWQEIAREDGPECAFVQYARRGAQSSH
ncbi:MAG TPA: dihydrofolate reductase [Verrucomicrobiae bacterium]|nr:dihydrofolate reductase [Verrucomicrobiae bacterium]